VTLDVGRDKIMNIIDYLVNNSKSALIASVEIHNKPIFPYRYEVVTILLINAWELILKAYLLKNAPDVKVIREDGTVIPYLILPLYQRYKVPPYNSYYSNPK